MISKGSRLGVGSLICVQAFDGLRTVSGDLRFFIASHQLPKTPLKLLKLSTVPQGKQSFDFIEAFHLGEEPAFDFYFRKYYSALCFFAQRYTSNSDAAKDIVQECFIKLWERRQLIEGNKSLQHFLYTSVRNRCIDEIRKSKVVQQKLAQIKVEEVTQEDLEDITRAETMRQVYEGITKLPAKMQRVFRMYYIEGKKYGEIASALGISYDTVRQQKLRALQILKGKILLFSFFIKLF